MIIFSVSWYLLRHPLFKFYPYSVVSLYNSKMILREFSYMLISYTKSFCNSAAVLTNSSSWIYSPPESGTLFSLEKLCWLLWSVFTSNFEWLGDLLKSIWDWLLILFSSLSYTFYDSLYLSNFYDSLFCLLFSVPWVDLEF